MEVKNWSRSLVDGRAALFTTLGFEEITSHTEVCRVHMQTTT